MTELKGFPPSSTIAPRTPKIVPTPMNLKSLQPENRFVSNGAEYMMLTNNDWRGPRAVLYKHEDPSLVGGIFTFSADIEVVWLKEIW